MKIFSYVVTRNEIGRYLHTVLARLTQQVDEVVVYDDRSDDGSAKHLVDLPISFVTRPVDAPSFLECESQFRQNAWRTMERVCDPRHGDWILSLDADEFLRLVEPDALYKMCEAAKLEGLDGIRLHCQEIWGTDEKNQPLIRTDGFWAQIDILRLCRWEPNGTFNRYELGGGSVPHYVQKVGDTRAADILHFGYATAADRQIKYDRYINSPGRHNIRHIESILKPPRLELLPV